MTCGLIFLSTLPNLMFVLGTSINEFIQPNLAVIMANGSVWDIKFRKNFKGIDKKLLIQLPQSRNYFGFSSKPGVLNFVRDDIKINIIQLKDQKHIVIPRSSMKFNEYIGYAYKTLFL